MTVSEVINKLVAAANKRKEQLEVIIENRETYYNSRSETWLESEKAEEYEDKTKLIQEKVDEIDSFIDCIVLDIDEL